MKNKQEVYDKLSEITALQLIEQNESLSIKTRVDAGIAKVKAKLRLAVIRNPKPKEYV